MNDNFAKIQYEKNQVKELTRLMLRKYYCESDVNIILEKIGEDIIWLGTGENEFSYGYEKVKNIFLSFSGQVPKCNIYDEEYHVIQLSENTYLCSGRLWIETDESTQICLRVHQRITTVFKLVNSEYKCFHIHISNPYEDMCEDDVGFPIRMAEQSYKYLQEQTIKQRQKIIEQTQTLLKMSYEDGLTGLYNRNKFNQIIDSPVKEGIITGVACFDLNGLKDTNDRLGHSAGDALICDVAKELKEYFPEKAYRIGGDEFIVVDHDLSEEAFKNKVLEARERMTENNISCSVGISWRNNNCCIKEQMDEADKLMYEEKRKFYSLIKNNRRKNRYYNVNINI